MLTRFLIFLCEVSPWARRALWRWWYEKWARRVGSGEWTFMNYGFAWPDGETAPELASEEEPDRFCIQLYHRVVAPGNLSGKEVLEVGAGRGGGAAFVKSHHHTGQLTAVDFSPQVVSFCQGRHRMAGLVFADGDAERLPFPAASFDAVINVESSHCYGSVPAFLAEVTRVLRPGGIFLYADLREAAEMAVLDGQLRFLPGMRMRETEDLTPGVVAALTADHGHKQQMIDRLIPAGQRAMFREFAGLAGSKIHRHLSDGTLRYRRWVLERVTT